ncbi:MAG: gliding motility lipoprotein GldD [Sphingobacteriales bacterium]|nr:gliding motility lipoprotein GldD [Sphingobacteriales bacterium]
MKQIKRNILSTKQRNIIIFLHCLIVTLTVTSCRENYTPKRTAYFRIEFPKERTYTSYSNTVCPFTFEYADYGQIQKDSSNPEEINAHPCWFNIIYPDYQGKIYLSYTSIDQNNTLDKLIRDSYKLTFKHTVKADYIDETPVRGKNKNVSGIVYDVGGNAASAVQFYVTDSSQHFLRGSLYFFASPNADSIAPAVKYFREDVQHIIETLQWK